MISLLLLSPRYSLNIFSNFPLISPNCEKFAYIFNRGIIAQWLFGSFLVCLLSFMCPNLEMSSIYVVKLLNFFRGNLSLVHTRDIHTL